LGFLFFFLSLLLSFLGRVGMVVRRAAALAEAELDVLHSSLRPRSVIIVDPPPLVEEEDEEDEEVVPELPVNWWRIFSFTPSSFCLSIFSSNFADEFCAQMEMGNRRAQGPTTFSRCWEVLASFLPLVLAAPLTNNSSLSALTLGPSCAPLRGAKGKAKRKQQKNILKKRSPGNVRLFSLSRPLHLRKRRIAVRSAGVSSGCQTFSRWWWWCEDQLEDPANLVCCIQNEGLVVHR
jgi:hypothetical protein